ncbi:MAG: MFS transporter [Actinomycetota bacterium]|nr:MFS transporter [Actinomycetota bacterium]
MSAPAGLLRRSPAFGSLVAARGVSLVGDGVGYLALIVHLQRTEGAGTAVALLLLMVSLPSLLSPVLGVAADRVDQRRLLIAGELGQALVVGAVIVWLPPTPVLLALVLAKATIATISEPAGRSVVPAVVDDRDLPRANSILGGVHQGGDVVGALVGGVVVAVGGVRAGLVVDAGSFVLSAPLLLRLPMVERDPEAATGGSWWRDAVDGLVIMWRIPLARAMAVAMFLIALSAADDAAVPFLATELGAGERGLGVLVGAVGAGLVVGYATIASRWDGTGRTLGFVAGGNVMGLGNVLTAAAPTLPLAVAGQLLRGFGGAVLEASLNTLVQRGVPKHALGRVFANVYGAANVAALAALLVGGPLLDATSPRFVLAVSGATVIAGAACAGVMLRRPERPG